MIRIITLLAKRAFIHFLLCFLLYPPPPPTPRFFFFFFFFLCGWRLGRSTWWLSLRAHRTSASFTRERRLGPSKPSRGWGERGPAAPRTRLTWPKYAAGMTYNASSVDSMFAQAFYRPSRRVILVVRCFLRARSVANKFNLVLSTNTLSSRTRSISLPKK